MRRYLLLIILICLAVAESPAVRIKDIAVISGMRANQLMGVGLVAGLKGTGDNGSSVTDKALTNLLVNMGVTNRQDLYRSKNIAVVMVTAELPAFVKPGQKIDVFVSSIGDATSLRDGNLLMTPLKGADDQVYAVAQGPIILGGRMSTGSNRNETVCKVVEGAIVEQTVPMEIAGKSGIALNLNKADFSTAMRVAEALDRAGYSGSRAIDPSTVEIPIEAEDREDLVPFIARVQDFMVVPDAVAKVVINQRTGTVVIGENVRLAPVAISHGDVEIRIEGGEENAEGENLDDALLAMDQAAAGGSPLAPQQQPEKIIKLVQLREGSTLSSLVKALNSVGTSPQDLIAILQGLKTAGALAAEIEVI
ncbi:MAG: flagellar basal body P-ring protein FlgI [Candidatus Margulisbacteria bacterium]|jgi:flagellar P-ring protein precursor FlgI|nr:flagellar basal body P-ring protein FlgI [Candidatus Margulisiibacteriota bacterium]